ncbi:hypothetical protein ACVW00_002211 [Marmoricola sp. URHA0025 HA25]
MPGRRLPGSPRATRAMIDLLYAVGSCAGVVGTWEVSGQQEGLVVRLRTPQTYDAEPAAIEAAKTMIKSVLPGGEETVSTIATARVEGRTAPRWRGVAEVVVAPSG